MIVVVMIIYIFGITMGGLSSNFTTLVVSRVIQGIGVATLPTAFGIIKDHFPQGRLAIAVGVFTSMSAAGSVVGLVLGASIIGNFGWRATFFSVIPISIILWFVIRQFIYDNKKIPKVVGSDSPKDMVVSANSDNKSKRGTNDRDDWIRTIDIKATITLAAAITSFLIALSYSDTNNNTPSTQIILFLFIGTISLMLFIITERRSESPLVNLKLLTNKMILSASIILVLIFLTRFAVFQTIPVLVRTPEPLGFGGEVTAIAGIQLPFMIIFLLFSPSSGIIISKLGSAKPTILGGIILFIGCFGLSAFHSTGYFVSINLAVIAAGISLMQVGSMNIILESTPRQFSGISLGMTVIFKMVGSSIGPVIAGRRPGNDGLVHKYFGRKKHGNRCGMGRHIKVCHRHYSIQKQKGRSILCSEFSEATDEQHSQSHNAAKATAPHNQDLRGWREPGGDKRAENKDRRIS
jgi:MFS family permease